MGLYDRCITRGIPNSMMPAGYGSNYEILQGQGWAAIRYEMIHETRVVPLDGRPHLTTDIRLDLGDPAATGKATRSSSRRRTSPSAASIAARATI